MTRQQTALLSFDRAPVKFYGEPFTPISSIVDFLETKLVLIFCFFFLYIHTFHVVYNCIKYNFSMARRARWSLILTVDGATDGSDRRTLGECGTLFTLFEICFCWPKRISSSHQSKRIYHFGDKVERERERKKKQKSNPSKI